MTTVVKSKRFIGKPASPKLASKLHVRLGALPLTVLKCAASRGDILHDLSSPVIIWG